MGKEPVQKPKKDPPSKTDSGGNGSALVVIIAIISVIGIGLYLFKDKIFKNKPKELPKEAKQDPPIEQTATEPEVVEGAEKEEISDKFAKLD